MFDDKMFENGQVMAVCFQFTRPLLVQQILLLVENDPTALVSREHVTTQAKSIDSGA